MKTYSVFDTETTGLSLESGDEIIEIAAVKVINGAISDQRFEQMVRPARSVPKEATAISGITNDMLAGKPMMRDVLPGFLEWLDSDILVAHNHNFDMGFLMQHCRTLEIKYAGNDVMDTMLLARKLYPGEKANLDDLIEKCGLQKPKQRHRALADALVTAELFIKLLNIIRDKGWDPFETLKPAATFAV
ncbi:PolC-type DNA polymerase III [Planctomycetota bacterium]